MCMYLERQSAEGAYVPMQVAMPVEDSCVFKLVCPAQRLYPDDFFWESCPYEKEKEKD
jgi:hypothetical protein